MLHILNTYHICNVHIKTCNFFGRSKKNMTQEIAFSKFVALFRNVDRMRINYIVYRVLYVVVQ